MSRTSENKNIEKIGDVAATSKILFEILKICPQYLEKEYEIHKRMFEDGISIKNIKKWVIKNRQDIINNIIDYEQEETTIIKIKKNAIVNLLLKNESWCDEEGYNIEPFFSNIRLCEFYAQNNKKKRRAPKKFAAQLLKQTLKDLIKTNEITKDLIIVVESDYPLKLKNYYEDIGFKFLATSIDNENHLLYSKVNDIIN